jgi:2-polyprenyl-6-methoxyphenol hydroxylase-like FAD-dependent oxidoreductase
LIIGGGIGGLTAALALARAGFPAHIVERSPEFGEIGAGIQLAPNALRILDGLGVLPELAALGVRPRHLVLMHADTGEHLTTVDFGERFERRYGYAYTVMHRGDLLTVLHQACRADDRITLEAGRDVTGLAGQGGTAEVRFADGGSYECGAVVGADGLWSTVRRGSAATARAPTRSSPTAASCPPATWPAWSARTAPRRGRTTRSSGSARTSTWCSTRSALGSFTTRSPCSAAGGTLPRPS